MPGCFYIGKELSLVLTPAYVASKSELILWPQALSQTAYM